MSLFDGTPAPASAAARIASGSGCSTSGRIVPGNVPTTCRPFLRSRSGSWRSTWRTTLPEKLGLSACAADDDGPPPTGSASAATENIACLRVYSTVARVHRCSKRWACVRKEAPLCVSHGSANTIFHPPFTRSGLPFKRQITSSCVYAVSSAVSSSAVAVVRRVVELSPSSVEREPRRREINSRAACARRWPTSGGRRRAPGRREDPRRRRRRSRRRRPWRRTTAPSPSTPKRPAVRRRGGASARAATWTTPGGFSRVSQHCAGVEGGGARRRRPGRVKTRCADREGEAVRGRNFHVDHRAACASVTACHR